MLWAAAADMPLRLLRMEPASEAVSLPLNRGGGAKSSAVKVPDLRRRWLRGILVVVLGIMHARGGPYGLGMGARSSKDDCNGMWADTAGEYGRNPPRGLSGRPACLSLAEVGGAKSIELKMAKLSSLSM